MLGAFLFWLAFAVLAYQYVGYPLLLAALATLRGRRTPSRYARDEDLPSVTLVISQVVLSFGIPFALVPLVRFTARRDLMGPLVNRRATTVAAVLVAALIIALNVFLLTQTLR